MTELSQSQKYKSQLPLRMLVYFRRIWKQVGNANSRSDERVIKQDACVENSFAFAKIVAGYAKLSHSWAGEGERKLLDIAIVVYGGLYG